MAKKQYLDYAGLTTYDEQIKAYVDSAAAGKADSNHSHDDKYYTESEIDSKLSGKADSTHNHAASNITSGTLSSDRLPTVPLTKGGTNATSAAGARTNLDVYSKSEVDTALSGKAASDHNHDSAYDAKGAAAAALTSAQSYADNAAATVKNDLLNGAGTAYDTLKELGDLIDDNADAIDALELVASGKADADHDHAIADVTGLQSALDGKAASSHGTHVTWATTAPKMDGTAAVGTVARVAREDHVHPTDTSRASQADLDSLESVVAGKADTGHAHSDATTSAAGFMTAAMVTKLNGIATGATKVTVDSALSTTSTNPVRNSVVTASINANTSAISSNTSSISAHTSRIESLEGLVGEGCEPIPTASITALFS